MSSSPLIRCALGATLLSLWACGSSTSPSDLTITQSPTGAGAAAVTNFAFTASGVSNATSYSWDFGDGATTTTTSGAANHVYALTGTYSLKVTATPSSGSSRTGSLSVTTKSFTGTWDATCPNRPAGFPSFPTAFVLTLTQSGTSVNGSMSGGGLSRAFTFPGTTTSPRRFSVGVETINNVWAAQDGDFYFNLTADDTMDRATGTSQYCGSNVVATRR